MMSALRTFYRRQLFNPGPIGVLTNPFFLARRSLWRAMALASRELVGPLLDVGCGTQPYRTLFAVDRYVGLDIDSAASRARGIADALYDGNRFPFEDASFNSVLCNQVLEHVFNPDQFLEEVRRVLVPGGRVLLTIPFVWDEHEQPYDYARYSTFGLRSLLERHGFRIIVQQKLLADASVLFQLTNAYLYKITRTRSMWINFLADGFVLAPVTLAGLLAGAVLPRNPDLFLDQLAIAERTS